MESSAQERERFVEFVLGDAGFYPRELRRWLDSEIESAPPRIHATAIEGGGIPFVTAAQFGSISAPNDNQQVSLEVSSVSGIYWPLQYRRALAKWIVLGQTEMYASVATPEALSVSGSYLDLPTVGPALVAPVAGIYMISHGCQIDHLAVAELKGGIAVVVLNGAAAPLASTFNARFDCFGNAGAEFLGTPSAHSPALTLASGDEVRLKYSTQKSSTLFSNRWIRLIPRLLG